MAVFARQISPKPINARAMRGELLGELRRLGNDVKKDFDSTTDTWEGAKPKMVSELELAQGRAALFVGPAGTGGEGEQKWNRLNDGTRGPYPIYPGAVTGKSNKVAMKFPGTYTAKTMPGVIGSRGGGAGGAPVFAKAVIHPGLKARKWDELIARKWTKRFAVRMQAAMKAAAAASGHAYP